MTSRTLRIATVLTTAMLFASLSGAASANRLSLSNSAIRLVIPEFEFVTEIVTVRCRFTLEGSFHGRTFAKVEPQLLGYITRGIINLPNCTDSGSSDTEISARNETLPWHISYEGFAGRLPNITEVFILLRNFGFLILKLPIIGTCRYTANAKAEVLPEAGGTRFLWNSTVSYPSETPFCPTSRFRISSSAPLTLLGTTSAIIIRLI